jgi:hypothetical protein
VYPQPPERGRRSPHLVTEADAEVGVVDGAAPAAGFDDPPQPAPMAPPALPLHLGGRQPGQEPKTRARTPRCTHRRME